MHQTLLIGVEISAGTISSFEDVGNDIFGIIRTVGIICSVVALIIIGMKYMIASVEEKAEYKKTFYTFLVGAVLVFGITYIVEVIYTTINDIL